MKTLSLIIILFSSIFWSTALEAQVVDVPKKSKEHFFKKYPEAKNADWNNNVVNYAVKFNLNETTNRAYYHMDGNWDYTETYLESAQLPNAVKESFKKSRFADGKTEGVALVENNKGEKFYRLDVKKGIEKNSVYYDKNGKEVKSNINL